MSRDKTTKASASDIETPWSAQELRRGLELHFFAHLNLAEDADKQLADLAFGRTHHRILYFASMRPGLTVGELTKILRVSNQSLNRPMRDLIAAQYLEQRMAPGDRRQRELHLTPAGAELLEGLSKRQFERIARAYSAAGREAVEGFWAVLRHLSMHPDPILLDQSEEVAADR